MKVKHLIIGLLIANSTLAVTDKKISQQEYVSMWKNEAIKQMNLHKIPASITLAQGILESANGNSDLAQKANNHFGIKCADWSGETFHKDDDQKDECFRKYNDATLSYEDHSLFLSKKSRYASLFKYEITDYKAWAKGLKEAGYATNPKYPDLIVELIERLHLNDFDNQQINTNFSTDKKEIDKKVVKTLVETSRSILNHKNDIKYVIAKKGDTYYRLSKELKIDLSELYKYNEFGDKKDYLEEGDIIFLAPKKRKAKNKEIIVLKTETTARIIAQQEGIRVKNLTKINHINNPDEKLAKGTKIKLK